MMALGLSVLTHGLKFMSVWASLGVWCSGFQESVWGGPCSTGRLSRIGQEIPKGCEKMLTPYTVKAVSIC